MQDADFPVLQVVLAVEEVDQNAELFRIEVNGHGVDGEVAPEKVELDGAQLNGGHGGRVFIVFEAGRGDINLEAVGQLHHGGVEFDVGADGATNRLGQFFGKDDSVAFDDHIQIIIFNVQQQVADKAPHGIGGEMVAAGHLADGLQQNEHIPVEGLGEQIGQVPVALPGRFALGGVQARQVSRVIDQQGEQVRSGNDPLRAAVFHDGDEALAVFNDQFLDIGQGGGRRQGGEFRAHEFGDRQMAQIVENRLAGIPPGKEPQDGVVLQDRQHGDAVADQNVVGLHDGQFRPDGNNRRGHQLPGLTFRAHMLVQQADQLFFRLDQGHVVNGGRRRRGMAAAIEFHGDHADIDLRDPASGNEVNPFPHAGQGKDDIEVFHAHELADNEGKFVNIVAGGDAGHGDRNGLDGVRGGGFDQLVEQSDIVTGQLVGDVLGNGGQCRPALHQPGHGPQVGGGRGAEGERTGIFMFRHGQQGRLLPADVNAPFLKDLDEDRGGGADRPHHFHVALHVAGGVGVMIVKVNLNAGVVEAFGKVADARDLPGVHDDEFRDFFQVNVLDALEIVNHHGLDKKSAQVLFLGTGKNQHRLRVELFGGHHGGHAVKVGV